MQGTRLDLNVMELIYLGESNQVPNQIPGMIIRAKSTALIMASPDEFESCCMYKWSKQLHDRPTSADPLGESTTPSMIIPITF